MPAPAPPVRAPARPTIRETPSSSSRRAAAQRLLPPRVTAPSPRWPDQGDVTGRSRDRPVTSPWSGQRGEGAVTLGGSNRCAAALRLELEGVSLIVGRAGARTGGAGAGIAVVLPLKGDAEAHFHLAALELLGGHGASSHH